MPKLTPEQVAAIQAERAAGVPGTVLARCYGVSQMVISRASRGLLYQPDYINSGRRGRLSREDAVAIREARKAGLTREELSRQYGIGTATIYNIERGWLPKPTKELTTDEVDAIWAARHEGVSVDVLAKRYGVSRPAIQRATHGFTRSKLLTAEEQEGMRAERLAGATTRQLAERYGVSPKTVAKIAPAKRLSEDEVEEIRTKRAAGALLRELAEQYSVDTSHLSRITRDIKVNRVADRSNKLTRDDVVTIRSEALAGTSNRELADRYGVGVLTISQVVRGVTWSHVPPVQGPKRSRTRRSTYRTAPRLSPLTLRSKKDQPTGGQHHSTKIPDEEILVILDAYAGGTTQRELADRYGVTVKTLARVLHGPRARAALRAREAVNLATKVQARMSPKSPTSTRRA